MDENEKKDVTTGCAVFVLAIPFLAWLQGWAASQLWQWFVVPTFHVEPVGIWPMYGVSLLVGMLTHTPSGPDKRSWSDKLGTSIALPLITVAFGWVVHAYAIPH